MTHHGTTLGSRDPGYYRYATSYCYPVGAPTRIPAIQQDAVLCTTRRILSLALYPHNRSYYGWPLGVYPPIPQIHGSEVSPRSYGSSYLGIPRSMDLMDDPSRVSPDPMDLMDDPIPGIPMDTGIQGITLFVCYPHPTTSYCSPLWLHHEDTCCTAGTQYSVTTLLRYTPQYGIRDTLILRMVDPWGIPRSYGSDG